MASINSTVCQERRVETCVAKVALSDGRTCYPDVAERIIWQCFLDHLETVFPLYIDKACLGELWLYMQVHVLFFCLGLSVPSSSLI